MDVLEKSGLSFGSGAEMQSTAPFARGAIRQQVFGGDTKIAAGKQKYMQMLSKIAAMDQKLGSLYGDPSSPLFIEHALKRERAKAGPATTGYKAAGDIQEEITQQEKELESETDETLKLYKLLASEKVKEEKAEEKATKKAKTVKTKEDKQLLKDTGRDITNKAQIYDQKARDRFLSKPKDFQKLWIRHMLEGNKPPKGGFKEKDIDANFKEWEKNYKKKTKTTKGKEKEEGKVRFK